MAEPDRVAHFWSRVDRSGGPDACWPWTGAVYKQTGYGQASKIDGSRGGTTAHRLAWIITYGDPGSHVAPSGKVVTNRVRHLCPSPSGPNRLCCNPAHLGVGSDKDNADDRSADGNTFQGEQVAISKLTASDVVEALTAHAAGASTSSLARRFGVSRMTMAAAIHGDTWSHVAPEMQRPARLAPTPKVLTAADVVEIRQACNEGQSVYSLAKRFGVNKATVAAVASRATWKHVGAGGADEAGERRSR